MSATRRVLGEVGVGSEAEAVYRILLANPGLSTDELSSYADLSPMRLRSILIELERLAMVTRLSGAPVRFQPAPPEAVVEALISSREEALRRTRLDARELISLRRLHADQVKITEIVEILTNREGYAQRWTQVQTATRHSLEVFVRPPFTRPLTPDDEAHQSEMVRRGVLSRGLYDQESLNHPGILEHMWRMVEVGERVRVVSALPMKLVLSDRRLGLVPFIQEDPEHAVDAGLAVHRSALLDALIALFELYWERGVDVRPGELPDTRDDGVSGEVEVLALLSSGFKDEAIARQLGVSTQTVRRRISTVLRRLGVTTRFQAGLAIGRNRTPELSRDN